MERIENKLTKTEKHAMDKLLNAHMLGSYDELVERLIYICGMLGAENLPEEGAFDLTDGTWTLPKLVGVIEEWAKLVNRYRMSDRTWDGIVGLHR